MTVHHVGVVGGGQLARMAAEAASALGLSLVVLAERADDAACGVASEVVIGSPKVEADMRALAARCDVITFDHELVDLAIIEKLVADGITVRPGTSTLAVATDKGHMRKILGEAGVAVPAHAVVPLDPGAHEEGRVEIGAFAKKHGWPIVLKATRGGYDGKGVWPVGDLDEVDAVLRQLTGEVLIEEMVTMQAELAVMVARRPSGDAVAWPAVETAQVAGVCREVLVPGRIPGDVMARASALGRQVAEIVDSVGVLAVELFWADDGRLLVNEIAARPHNSGHWTIEGAVTSQFENHIRAVRDLPLGATEAQHAQVASVNVFGGSAGDDPVSLLPLGLAVEGAHVHLYGKEGRPGRKLGHVTVVGTEEADVRKRAWAAALALGTPRPDGVELPEGLG